MTFEPIGRHLLSAVALLFVIVTTPLGAQRIPQPVDSLPPQLPIGLGDRVLVRSTIHRGQQLEGVVMDIDGESMLLALAGDVGSTDAPVGTPERLETIPLSTIRTLHVYRPAGGAAPRGRSALGWAMVGAGAGAIAGGVVMAILASSSDRPSSPATIPLGVLAGAVVGAGAGGIYGAARAPNPWQAVYLPRAVRERR